MIRQFSPWCGVPVRACASCRGDAGSVSVDVPSRDRRDVPVGVGAWPPARLPSPGVRAVHGTRSRGCVAGPELLRRARAGTQPIFVVTALRSASRGRAATGQRSGSPLRALAVIVRVVEWWWATVKLAALIVLVGLTVVSVAVDVAGWDAPHRLVDFRHDPSTEKPDAPTAAVQAQPGRLQLSGDPTWEQT